MTTPKAKSTGLAPTYRMRFEFLISTYFCVDARELDFELAGRVHIEAEHDPRDPLGETRWLSELAASSGLPTACVCQAWLDRGDVAEVLAAQAEFPLVRGIRHKPAAAADPREARRGAPGSMDDAAWRRGYALLAGHGERGLQRDLITTSPSRLVMMGDPVWYEVRENTGRLASWHGVPNTGNLLFLDGSVRFVSVAPKPKVGAAVFDPLAPDLAFPPGK